MDTLAPGGCAKAANFAWKIGFQLLSAGGESDWLTKFCVGRLKKRAAEGESAAKGWAERERKKTKRGQSYTLQREREVCLWVMEEQHP